MPSTDGCSNLGSKLESVKLEHEMSRSVRIVKKYTEITRDHAGSPEITRDHARSHERPKNGEGIIMTLDCFYNSLAFQ